MHFIIYFYRKSATFHEQNNYPASHEIFPEKTDLAYTQTFLYSKDKVLKFKRLKVCNLTFLLISNFEISLNFKFSFLFQ